MKHCRNVVLATLAVAATGCGQTPTASNAANVQAGNGHAAAQGNGAAPATGGVDDPVAFVREAFSARPGSGAATSFNGYSREPEFSPRLRAMFEDDERYANGEVGRLAFNPYTGTQDDEISQVEVTGAEVEGAPDRRLVTAHFRNIGQPQTMHVYFERIGGRWYVDDIASPGRPGAQGQPPWTLSLILRYGG